MKRRGGTEEGAPVFLHIGAMKTGSTYLQQMLLANREALAESGILFPGERWIHQVRAAQDAVGIGRKDPKIRTEAAGAWDRLARTMREHRGNGVVMSMEFLSFATPKQATRVVRSLAACPVHVVLTVRDAAGVIPSQWQTGVRTGSTTSWTDYMAGVRMAETQPLLRRRPGRDDRALRSFLRTQDTVRMLETWGALVDPSRLHVVTVPRSPSSSRELWDRFAAAVGIPPSVGTAAPKRTNQSLGFASTELLRQVNLALEKHRRTEYNRVIKDYLAAKVLTRLADDERPARIDVATGAFANRWNGRVAAAIQASGSHVVGDLADLPTTALVEPTASPPAPPSDAELLRAAGTAEEALERLVRRLARRVGAPGADPGGSSGGSPSDGVAPDFTPTDVAVARVAALAAQAIQLRRRLKTPQAGRP